MTDLLGIKSSGGSIRGYELGWNEAMDPVVLGALANLYREPVGELIAVLAANRANPDLTDFDVEGVLRRYRGSHELQVRAAERYIELGARLAEISAEFAGISGQANELRDRIAAADNESRRQVAEAGNDSPARNPDR